MKWNKSLETGDALVDEQHKEIFRLVQQVLDADTFTNPKEKIETAMGFLSDYAVRHFASEEALMRECNYPEYNNHKGLHDNFVKEVIAFIGRYAVEGDSISITDTINNFVLEWLKDHIMGHDKAMAEFYKEYMAKK